MNFKTRLYVPTIRCTVRLQNRQTHTHTHAKREIYTFNGIKWIFSGQNVDHTKSKRSLYQFPYLIANVRRNNISLKPSKIGTVKKQKIKSTPKTCIWTWIHCHHIVCMCVSSVLLFEWVWFIIIFIYVACISRSMRSYCRRWNLYYVWWPLSCVMVIEPKFCTEKVSVFSVYPVNFDGFKNIYRFFYIRWLQKICR